MLADRISKIDLQLFLLIIIRFQLEENIAIFLNKKDYATTTQKIYTLDKSLPYSFIRKSTHWTNHSHIVLYYRTPTKCFEYQQIQPEEN